MFIIIQLMRVYSYTVALIGESSDTSNYVRDYFLSSNPSNNLFYFEFVEDFLQSPPPLLTVIFENSGQAVSQYLISNYASEYSIPLIIIGIGKSTGLIFYTEYDYDCQLLSVLSLLQYYQIKRLGMVWTNASKNLKLQEDISKQLIDSETVSVKSTISLFEMSTLVSKSLKIDGRQNYLFLRDKTTCFQYEQAMKNAYLNVQGYLGIFLDECIFQISLNGSIALTKPGTESSTSYKGYLYNYLDPYLRIFTNITLSKFQIISRLIQINNSCKYSIVNIQNSQKVVIGTIIEGEVAISIPTVYYGGSINRSESEYPSVRISANTGIINPPGYPSVYQNQNYQQGTYFGVQKVNSDHKILPTFKLVLFDQVNCGVSVFVANFSKACFLAVKNQLGVAYISTLYQNTPFVLPQIMSLGINIPVVGGVGSVSLLSNTQKYPDFIRVVSPTPYFSQVWANLIQVIGWQHIAMLYSNDSFGLSLSNILASQAPQHNFTIINDPTMQMVYPALQRSDLNPYISYFQNIINLGANVVFLVMGDPGPFFALEVFYDLGIRRGDLTFIFFTITGVDGINATGGNPIKRAELLHGTLVLYNADWIGEYGNQLKQEFLTQYSNPWMRSFYIDVVLTIANTVDFLLNQGKAYENSTEFMNAIRNMRILGATGVVSFDKSSNDRNLYHFYLYNIYQDSVTGQWHSVSVALIAPVSIIYYTQLQTIVWPNGVLPLDLKLNFSNCPFRQDQIQTSHSGEGIKIGVSIFILILASCLTIYSLKKLKVTSIQMIQAKCVANFEDYLTLGFILVEAAQVIAIGPAFLSFDQLLSNLSGYLSLNLSNAISFKDSTFWAVFYFMMILGYFWILILFLSYFIIFERILKSFYFRILTLKSFSIPVMSNYLFLPEIVCCISILACDNATGGNLTDSYLNYDCNLNCWTGSHVSRVVPACFLIVVYIPVAILYRTLWQEENTNLNIRANSLYLTLKNISYVTLIILGKILKDDYALIHAIIFEVIIVGIFVFVILNRPFNFDRANLWATSILVCIMWNTLVCIFNIISNVQNYVWLILQLLGWACIIIVTLVLQSRLPPSLIITLKGKKIGDLFKFAFGLEILKKSTYENIVSIEDDME